MSSDNECSSDLTEPESPSDSELLTDEAEVKDGDEQEANCNETDGRLSVREGRSSREDEEVSTGEDRGSRCGRVCENRKSEVKGEERQCKKREKGEEVVDHGEWRETDSRKEKIEVREEVEEDVRERERIESAGVERSIQVLDGRIALGSVQWKDCRAQAAGRFQVQSAEILLVC